MTYQSWQFWDSGARAPIRAWTHGVSVEPEAIKQVRNVATPPFVEGIAVMPDAHYGIGATVGSVIATSGAIIPAAVGVDIGCGCAAVRTDLSASDLPDSLTDIRSAIEAAVPHGRTNNGRAGDHGAWGNVPEAVEDAFRRKGTSLGIGLDSIVSKHPQLAWAANRVLIHLGTLGTGNHFIEVCLDENNDVWVMLHSGSRGIGNAIGKYFIEKAKLEMRKWFINLPDEDLAYLPYGSEFYDDYLEGVHWAQEYAHLNRRVMMSATLTAISNTLGRPITIYDSAIECHHNYVDREHYKGDNLLVTRKGAVRARLGDLGIIPGSMGAKSFIVRGKGNEDSFNSCSHGAGRAMSRGVAKKTISVDEHIAATAGVECKKDASVLDESPAAYKDVEKVMQAQADLVDVVHTLKQVVCIKG